MRLDRGEVIKLRTTDFPELRLLETLGFLISTEEGYYHLAVKVKGHTLSIMGEHFFCINGEHYA